jgi:hypothetical protein
MASSPEATISGLEAALSKYIFHYALNRRLVLDNEYYKQLRLHLPMVPHNIKR